MNKILFLSYYFPPMSEIGGKRIDKMCALALKKEWQPTVVTNKPHLLVDKIFSQQFGNVDIFFTNTKKQPLDNQLKETTFRRYVQKVLARIFKLPIFFYKINKEASNFYKQAICVIKDNNILYFLSSGPPIITHLAGIRLKRKSSKLVWIADFRDPLLLPQGLKKFSLKKKFNHIILQKVLHEADLITVTTQSIKDILIELTTEKITQKIQIINNGIDVNLFDKVTGNRLGSTNTILFGHLGDLDYEHRNPESLIKALGRYEAEKAKDDKNVELHLWGKTKKWNGKSIEDMANEYSINKAVTRHNYVPHTKAISIIQGLDVLVLFAYNQITQIPAKTYEYLLSGTHILAFCEKHSETGKLLSNFPNVVIIHSNQFKDVYIGLKEIIDKVLRPMEISPQNGSLNMLNYEENMTPLFTWLDQHLKNP